METCKSATCHQSSSQGSHLGRQWRGDAPGSEIDSANTRLNAKGWICLTACCWSAVLRSLIPILAMGVLGFQITSRAQGTRREGVEHLHVLACTSGCLPVSTQRRRPEWQSPSALQTGLSLKYFAKGGRRLVLGFLISLNHSYVGCSRPRGWTSSFLRKCLTLVGNPVAIVRIAT